MDKYQLLKHDYLDIVHPVSKINVRIFRIISLRPIENPFHGHIPAETIGGYVQSMANLDMNDESWLFHTSKVFGNAVVSLNTVVYDSAAIFEAATVGGSIIRDYSKIYGEAKILSSVFEGRCTISGKSNVNASSIYNSCLIDGYATVIETTMKDGSMIRGSAKVSKSVLTDTCEIGGTANIINCNVGGRYVCMHGQHVNESLFDDIELNIESGKSAE